MLDLRGGGGAGVLAGRDDEPLSMIVRSNTKATSVKVKFTAAGFEGLVLTSAAPLQGPETLNEPLRPARKAKQKPWPRHLHHIIVRRDTGLLSPTADGSEGVEKGLGGGGG